MRHADAAGTVGDDHQRPFDGLRLALDGRDTGGAVQVFESHRRDAANTWQACREQRLPVLRHDAAQAWHDKNSWLIPSSVQ
jgi:hypothetical protein